MRGLSESGWEEWSAGVLHFTFGTAGTIGTVPGTLSVYHRNSDSSRDDTKRAENRAQS